MNIKSLGLKLLSALAWFFGITFMLVGFVAIFQEGFFVGLLMMIGGLVLLPPIKREAMHKVPKLSRGKLSASGTALIIGSMIGFSTPETVETQTEPMALVSDNQPTEPVKQDEIEQAKPVTTKKTEPEPVVQPVAIYDINCRVVGVTDGDTIKCLTDEKALIKVRMHQIDAPESKQDFGQASKKVLSDLVYDKDVGLKTNGKDKYGRTIAEVYINNTNVNKAMVAAGMAWAYREYLDDDSYIDLEQTAKDNKLGLWSQPNPVYPSEFRHKPEPKKQVVAPEQKPQQIAEIKPKPKPEPILPAVSNDSCSGLPRTCGKMSSCSQARKALACGNGRLDRDNDGIPCESLCGG